MKSDIMIMAGYKAVYKGNFLTTIFILVEKLKQKGMTVSFVFPAQAKERAWHTELESMGTVYYVSYNRKERFWEVMRLYRNEKSSIVYAHFGFDNEMAVLSWLYPKAKFYKHSRTDMGVTLPLLIRWEQYVKRRTFMAKIKTIVVSQQLKETNKSYCVADALVENRLEGYCALDKNGLRREYGIKEDEVFVLMFAWDLHVKGFDIACAALEYILKWMGDVKLGVVCNDKGMERINNEMDLPDKVRGHMILLEQTEDINRYYCMADIFLSPSRSEGFPNAILESLWLGKPIVYSNIAGCRWCREFLSTYVFESEDSFACAKTLLHVIWLLRSNSVSDLLEDSKRYARQIIMEKYSMDAWADKIMKIFKV